MSWPHLEGIELADPDCHSDDPVELLLGADTYAAILRPGLRNGGPLAPLAQQTTLGWILSGIAGSRTSQETISSNQCAVDEQLTSLVCQFWEQEEWPKPAEMALTAEDQKYEDFFATTHSRTPEGRYVVRLPLKSAPTDLSDTRVAAVRLLQTMERRFRQHPTFQHSYQDFMLEYEPLGHMTKAAVTSRNQEKRTCYLPHHGVIKESSTTTKLRVVFNGSQRGTRGVSLNDHLLTGPNLLPALADVLLRWRTHRYAVVADIEKMYRQVLVHPDDRDLQRIIWRDSVDQNIQEFKLNTVTYGLACAPYLAIRTRRQLATDEGKAHLLAASALMHDIYVDDILTGASTLSKTKEA
ncbi:hypothetical protein RF55_23019, partial [Lasius niger]